MNITAPNPDDADLSSLHGEVDRTAAAANRAGPVGLPPLTDALLNYLDAMAAADPALTHPHVRPTVLTASHTTRAYFGARLRHTSDAARCELPLLRMSLAAGPDESLGAPSIHDWLEAFELALICRNGGNDHYLRSQAYTMYYPHCWAPDDAEAVRIPAAYATALAALAKRARWPRNKQVRAEIAELMPPALDRLAEIPAESPWTPRVQIVRLLAAGEDATPQVAAAVEQFRAARRIAWPLLALAALAHDLNLPAQIESDYLPKRLMIWQP
ncbi:Imm49 family immunity protein [Nocardia sp. NPDC057440]|uniref:Imm49 family immunity protein n=1 Tax=Nocardia sp. NPDC057440 TaxID=3346134 RepID=UPI00366E7440